MLKRIGLVLMLLTALVGSMGVQAQTAVQPQSMAKYLPANTEVFFAVRSDEAFLDELTGVMNGIVQKLPDMIASQVKGIDLKTMLQSQVGSMSAIGVGDYVAVGIGNTAVGYDQDPSNNSDLTIYGVIALTDAAKFEAFFESRSSNMTKTEENGVTVYSSANGSAGKLFVTDDAAYATNQDALPTGAMLDSVSKFNDTVGTLPESSYNFVLYSDATAVLKATMSQSMTPQNAEMLSKLGLDVTSLSPVALGGTILGGNSLVIDVASPSLGAVMPATAPIDPAFASNIPSGTSYVIHGTDLKSSLNAVIDVLYKANDIQISSGGSSTLPSRKDINTQLKSFLGIDLDNDIIGWMGGNYAIIGDANIKALIDSQVNGKADVSLLDARFAFIVQGDGSDKPAKLVQALGALFTAQYKNVPSAPKITMSSSADQTVFLQENVPVSGMPGLSLNLEMVGRKDLLVMGDQITVEAILKGMDTSLSDDASFVEAQTYILPNASVVAFADGEGWGNVLAGGIAGAVVAPTIFSNITAQLSADPSSPTPTPIPTDDLLKPVKPLLDSAYGLISSSSLSVAYTENGMQLTRAVLTLK